MVGLDDVFTVIGLKEEEKKKKVAFSSKASQRVDDYIEKIPDIFRDMSKLWNKTGPKGNSGVGKRRREEAEIFERGLKCDCYK